MLVARLAPSPTGVLHLGNIRTFMCAWLSARAQNGRVVLRMEDLEYTRATPEAQARLLEDLAWLGFDWDEGPSPDGSERGPHGPYVQTRRRSLYKEVFEQFRARGLIYPCTCTRADLAAASSAPQEGDAEPRYPGTCRGRYASEAEARAASGRAPAWRLQVPPGVKRFEDLFAGPQEIDIEKSVGDFVVFKAPDNPSYQLAVVADDIAMGVNEVVRGDDLIPSTGRQLLLYEILKAAPPRYGHVPLVVGPNGKRLAKRHGDAKISLFRDRGATPEKLTGVLARWLGLEVPADASLRDLIPLWSWGRVPRERIILTDARLAEIDSASPR